MSDFPDPVKGELPAKGTRLYRGSKGGEVDKAGIHWSLDKRIAESFAIPKYGGHVMEVEVDDPEKQVIPRVSLTPRNPLDAQIMANKNLLASEQEYHLRPGAKLRVLNRDQLGEHFPEHVEIEHTGRGVAYTNLSQYAATAKAAGNIEDNDMRRFGYKQTAMFSPIVPGFMGLPYEDTADTSTTKYVMSPDVDFNKWSVIDDDLGQGMTAMDMGVYTPPKK